MACLVGLVWCSLGPFVRRFVRASVRFVCWALASSTGPWLRLELCRLSARPDRPQTHRPRQRWSPEEEGANSTTELPQFVRLADPPPPAGFLPSTPPATPSPVAFFSRTFNELVCSSRSSGENSLFSMPYIAEELSAVSLGVSFPSEAVARSVRRPRAGWID